MSDPRPPEERAAWPPHDFERDEPSGEYPEFRYPTRPPPPEPPVDEPPWPAAEPAAGEPAAGEQAAPEPDAAEPEEPGWSSPPSVFGAPREPDEPAAAEPMPASEPIDWREPLESHEPPDADEPMEPGAPPEMPEPDAEEAEEAEREEAERAEDADEPVETESAPTITAFSGGGDGWDPRRQGERRRPTTAEQAVPWLIGIILALAGMVIVLIALIFSGPDGLIAGVPSPTPTPSSSVVPAPSGNATPAPTATPQPTAGQTPSDWITPSPIPTYGPLEMVYLGRQSATAPVSLLRRDFSTTDEARVAAKASSGVEKYAWSPDGTRGVAIINDRAMALVRGESNRRLADEISAATFSWDSETVYAIRVVRAGANDRADVLAIDFASGGTEVLAGITYEHPIIGPEAPLREAAFIDDGGTVRVYATNDGNVVAWILGAPAVYQVDPGDGRVTEAPQEPVLWSPDGRYRVTLTERPSGATAIRKRDRSGATEAMVVVSGLVSHVSWAPESNAVVFTLGQSTSTGGVRQNLHLWDLVDGKAPAPLTTNGASFGADWLGVAQSWQP